MRPLYLRASGQAVAAVHHPARPAPSGTGVVLVPPLGWDDQCAYRPRRDWAEALAGAGHAALRIDLPGTGDSEGGPLDPGRVDAWVAAVAAAAEWLREDGCGRVTVVGVGVGGLIALAAIARNEAIDDAVLWGMPARGRTAVRELKAFGRLEWATLGEEPEPLPDGEIMAGGHRFSAETVAALSALDSEALLDRRAPRRALVLGKDGSDPAAKELEALRAAGTDVTTGSGRGLTEMLAIPQASRAPTGVIETVNRWLAAAPPATGTAGGAPAPEAIELSVDGVTVRETMLFFPGGPGRLFGVLTEPVGRPAVGSALLLNPGAIRHIGPNRMWTETARRWAVMGISTLRMDIEGMGDADGDPAPYRDGAGLYRPLVKEQTRLALDLMADRGLPERFLLASVCSGAYWAFQTALDDPRVTAVVTLNQGALFYDPDAEPQRELQRFLRVFTPTGFKYMLMGDRRLLRLWRLLVWLATAPARRLRRGHAEPADRLSVALGRMRDQGQRYDLAFSAGEHVRAELEAAGLDRVRALGAHLHDLPHSSHTLRPLGAQRAASALLDDVARRTFGADAE